MRDLVNIRPDLAELRDELLDQWYFNYNLALDNDMTLFDNLTDILAGRNACGNCSVVDLLIQFIIDPHGDEVRVFTSLSFRCTHVYPPSCSNGFSHGTCAML